MYKQIILILIIASISCKEITQNRDLKNLAKTVIADDTLKLVLEKAKKTLVGRFNAGENYKEVWIRDFATFIDMSIEVNDHQLIRENLLTFFDFQAQDGNIPDGFVFSKDAIETRYAFRSSPQRPGFWAHKNTVETDQETSLILAIASYIKKSGDRTILDEKMNNVTVLNRLEYALDYLLKHRFSDKYGLLIGATTVDWGDVQPEHAWGTYITEDTHWCIDIYDNAMFVMALKEYLNFLDNNSQRKQKWTQIFNNTKTNIRKYLWSGDKFIPHIYLDSSPFPSEWDENVVYYHGGTTAAMLADLLSHTEAEQAIRIMINNKNDAQAMSIGLTVYPPYPDGYFKNLGHKPYNYINGGDWTWWGGRTIQAMIQNGFYKQAYAEIYPMLRRVIKNDGFFEWYSVKNHEPHGAGTFLGAAGSLGKAIVMLQDWAINYHRE